MTQNGGMPAQLQGDGEGVEALPLNPLECGKAASDGSWTRRCDPGYQPIRATHSRVGAMNERDTDVRRGSIMLQRRIASAGAAVQSAHLYGDGVSIVPNVCLEWVEPPEPSGSASGRRRRNTFESQTLRGRETVLDVHFGPAGAFKQKSTVSLWKKAFAAPSTLFERVFWSFYSTVRSDM